MKRSSSCASQPMRALAACLRLTLATLLLIPTLLPAPAAAGQHGFLVFSTRGAASYVISPKGDLLLAGKASGSADDYLAANGNIYHLDKLLRKVSLLGPDLKPLLEARMKRGGGDIPDWLGTWDRGLLVMSDNSVLYLDSSLRTVARVPLDPRKYDQITPSLHPDTFLEWKGLGYLLANTGEIFVIPLGRQHLPGKLAPAISIENGLHAEGLWIDPEEETLNLLARTRNTEYAPDLKPGEWRETLNDVVLTYRLGALGDQPRRTIIHEQKEIHWPESRPLQDNPADDGVVYERMPPYRGEGKATGVHVGLTTRSTPAYAQAFLEDAADVFPARVIIRLGSDGRYAIQQPFRDKAGTWISVDGNRRYIEADMEELLLRMHPESYEKLKALPGLAGAYVHVVSY